MPAVGGTLDSVSDRTPTPARGSREYANAQIRVIGSGDAPYHPERRLRLPGERRFSTGQILRSIAVLATLGGIAAGIFFGLSALLEQDDAAPAAAAASEAATDAEEATAAQAATAATETSEPEPTGPPAAAQEEPDVEETAPAPAEQDEQLDDQPEEQSEQPVNEQAEAGSEEGEAETAATGGGAVAISAARAEPTVSPDPVRREDLPSGPLFAERMTAEPVPSGIPRTLADGSSYDASDPATAFSSLWPAGTTLHLTRLGDAALLDAEQQAEVAGTQVLVVVRGSEASNSDLQLSAAAFDRIAFYGIERIIAVEVEVTAAPPR